MIGPPCANAWPNGSALPAATLVYEGKNEDLYIAAYRDLSPGYERDFVSRTLAFYNDELYLRGKDGKLTKIDVPTSVNKDVHNQ